MWEDIYVTNYTCKYVCKHRTHDLLYAPNNYICIIITVTGVHSQSLSSMVIVAWSWLLTVTPQGSVDSSMVRKKFSFSSGRLSSSIKTLNGKWVSPNGTLINNGSES